MTPRYEAWLPLLLFLFPVIAAAQQNVPPYDLWTDDVLAQIRRADTLDYQILSKAGYYDAFFTSNPSASFFDSDPPYAEHTNEKIRIHAYLAVPAGAGPFPALVIGHGHGGKADLTFALMVAGLGYAALYIDGPRAGQSTGGPKDDVVGTVTSGADPNQSCAKSHIQMTNEHP